MGGLGSSRSKIPHVGSRKRKRMLVMSAERSPNFLRAAAHFWIADGNPVVPLPNTTGHKIEANRKNGLFFSEPVSRSTSLVGMVSVSHSKIAAAS